MWTKMYRFLFMRLGLWWCIFGYRRCISTFLWEFWESFIEFYMKSCAEHDYWYIFLLWPPKRVLCTTIVLISCFDHKIVCCIRQLSQFLVMTTKSCAKHDHWLNFSCLQQSRVLYTTFNLIFFIMTIKSCAAHDYLHNFLYSMICDTKN